VGDVAVFGCIEAQVYPVLPPRGLVPAVGTSHCGRSKLTGIHVFAFIPSLSSSAGSVGVGDCRRR
jgi:hypothetical protein